MREILAALPQASQIDQADAERWVASIMRYHAKRAVWHAKRLHGIGGSEMGAVIRGMNNLKESGFSNFSRIVEQKLMKRLPEFQTVHMKRGTVLEDLARRAFLYRYNAEQDLAALQAVGDVKVKPGYEWLVGNPDDFVMINGKRFLADYKVPSSFDDSIDFDYRVQLHHYGLLGQMAGVKIDGMILAKLDLAPELAASLVSRIPTMSERAVDEMALSIARADMPGMRVVGFVVEKSRDLQMDILDCGATAWNDYVLQGVVPPKPREQLVELDDETMLAVAQYQQQYAMAKAGIKHLEQVAEAASAGICSALEGVDFEGKALPLSLVIVNPNGLNKPALIEEAKARGAKPEELGSADGYSITALIEEIKRLNGDPEAAHLKAEPVPSADRAQEYLKNLGVDLKEFVKPGISLRMSTKKADKEIAGMFERSASERFGSWLDESAVKQRQDDDDQLEEAFKEFDLEVTTGTLHEVFAGAQSTEPNQTLTTPSKKSASLR
ncbi:YqaJ viral recombinase family protein (plasmid) [Stutzerimonas frequens]|uniref:YqaJ viral recombinase family protein n=1 Tax=Stutzerimonas frequens TaxID=2968969 RepID=UPI002DBC64F5|nr:YqaJ viral recombinase family protein [Stutzerimonas frequens]WRW29266.1 YqaJ viral recombinase family protein [Stutzerimonas frequens]